MENEITAASIQSAAEILKEEIEDSIRKFIDTTNLQPSVSITNSTVNTRCGLLHKNDVTVYVQVTEPSFSSPQL